MDVLHADRSHECLLLYDESYAQNPSLPWNIALFIMTNKCDLQLTCHVYGEDVNDVEEVGAS